ncbi:MAG: methyltransferase domain-containing protein [Phycisphaerae bacterium]
MKNEITDFFDEMAGDRNLVLASDPVLEYEQTVRSRIVFSMLDPNPGEAILDVGCANGRDLIILFKKGCKCTGIDFSSSMIEEAKKDFLKNNIEGIEVETGDATVLGFPDKTFDKIYASEVLEHIPNYGSAVSELARVLRPGGCLVISTPNRRSWYGFDRYVIWEKLLRKKWRHPYDAWKTFEELLHTLDSNGFKIVSVGGICYLPGFLISYHLPKIMKKGLVWLVKKLEPWLSKKMPKNGYSIAIKAVKK